MWCQYHLVEHLGEMENPYSPTDARYYSWEREHALTEAAKQYYQKKYEAAKRKEKRLRDINEAAHFTVNVLRYFIPFGEEIEPL